MLFDNPEFPVDTSEVGNKELIARYDEQIHMWRAEAHKINAVIENDALMLKEAKEAEEKCPINHATNVRTTTNSKQAKDQLKEVGVLRNLFTRIKKVLGKSSH
jgi:hypothetical protein